MFKKIFLCIIILSLILQCKSDNENSLVDDSVIIDDSDLTVSHPNNPVVIKSRADLNDYFYQSVFLIGQFKELDAGKTIVTDFVFEDNTTLVYSYSGFDKTTLQYKGKTVKIKAIVSKYADNEEGVQKLISPHISQVESIEVLE